MSVVVSMLDVIVYVWEEFLVFFFVCTQKTAYEMRISDWSSDVCSSDLRRGGRANSPAERRRLCLGGRPCASRRPFGPPQHEAYWIVSVGKPRPEEARRVVSKGGFSGPWNRRTGFSELWAASCSDARCRTYAPDRKSVVEGQSVTVRVDLGGRRVMKKHKDKRN